VATPAGESGGSPSAIVFDIQRTSMNDGPGIRTTVFLKGCNLRCIWCHNPESFETRPQMVVLPNGTERTYGTPMSVDEVFAVVVADRAFYESTGGGVTVSGGEPLLQIDFVQALFRQCRDEGIGTALETNGTLPRRAYERIAGLTDHFLYDYKATGAEAHMDLTGGPIGPVLANLSYIVGTASSVTLRVPLVQTVNATEAHLAAIAGLALRYPSLELEIMPYHATARDKWHALGIPYRLAGLPSMEPAAADALRDRIVELGCPSERIVVSS
jgi:pyruvate formate lyase activating enzyme